MKNEDRIIELLIEALQRIDQHHAQIEQILKKLDVHSEQFERQQEASDAILIQIQKHQERLDRHGEAFDALRERTEAIHQSSLEQVKAYQAITELVMFHNSALRSKGIL